MQLLLFVLSVVTLAAIDQQRCFPVQTIEWSNTSSAIVAVSLSQVIPANSSFSLCLNDPLPSLVVMSVNRDEELTPGADVLFWLENNNHAASYLLDNCVLRHAMFASDYIKDGLESLQEFPLVRHGCPVRDGDHPVGAEVSSEEQKIRYQLTINSDFYNEPYYIACSYRKCEADCPTLEETRFALMCVFAETTLKDSPQSGEASFLKPFVPQQKELRSKIINPVEEKESITNQNECTLSLTKDMVDSFLYDLHFVSLPLEKFNKLTLQEGRVSSSYLPVIGVGIAAFSFGIGTAFAIFCVYSRNSQCKMENSIESASIPEKPGVVLLSSSGIDKSGTIRSRSLSSLLDPCIPIRI